jgi:aspartyl protease family protein
VPFSRSNFEVIGTGASGAVRGQLVTIDRLSIDGKEVREVRGAVLEGLEISLLGQSYLSRIGGVEMAGDSMTLR